MAEPKKQIPLRLNAKLYDALAAWAEDDFRSVNGQIEYLLTVCVSAKRTASTSLTGSTCRPNWISSKNKWLDVLYSVEPFLQRIKFEGRTCPRCQGLPY